MRNPIEIHCDPAPVTVTVPALPPVDPIAKRARDASERTAVLNRQIGEGPALTDKDVGMSRRLPDH